MYQKEKENHIIEVTYEMAEKVYNVNYKKLANLGIEKEDFAQDAVMYILDLYRKDYIFLEEGRNPRGMIFKMLSLFLKNTMTVKIRLQDRRAASLNTFYEDVERIELQSEKTLMNPEQWSLKSLEVSRGKMLLEEIVESFEDIPFGTIKHTYVDKGNEHPFFLIVELV